MDLQRTIGNAAVARMVEEEAEYSAFGQEDPQPIQRSTAHAVLRSPGRPLDKPVRTEMEARLGSDFSDVRVHDDSAARVSAAEVGALAYTSGNHVVIGGGGADLHTLAHELTHVIQQRKGPVAGTDNGDGLKVSDPSDRFEREAEANARRAMAAPLESASARSHESPGQTRSTPPASAVRNSRDPRPLAELQSTMGNAAVSQLITVSRMMTEDDFKQSTATFGPRGRSEITKVDNALKAFYALPDTRPGVRLLALKDIVKACADYADHKAEGGARVGGAQQLGEQAKAVQAQLDPEAVFRDLLTELDRMMSEGKNPDLDIRMPAGEAQKAAQAVPAEQFHAMMGDFVQKLGALREDQALPEETRAVIGELMAVVPLVTVMQYPQGGMPGMKLNPTTGDGGPAFTFNVDTQARGGTSFLLGHIAHELTHVAAHQAFGSSPVMELVQSGATNEEVAALAAERKQALSDLKSELAGNPEFDEFQQGMLEEKLVYGAQPHKLERYADSFEKAGKITAAQKERLVGWGKAAGDASGTLVEYDTVLNQMLIYLHMWQIDQHNPFYVRLRAVAQAAYDRRSRARQPTGQPVDQSS
ncbi:DUF4157 domain-containing protein [Streptomyces sp. BE133]|nr:DUF4157 domain-containing protein [Streptomyces sp. BE133]MEE1805197.1 DUF4157 domain-containing protein [Streptomyces sp. BE133]